MVLETSATALKDPIAIAIFNGAQYNARVMINYVHQHLQKETGLHSEILEGDERSLYLPNDVTNVRIRVNYVGILKDRYVIDEQIHDFNQTKERCYVLAGTTTRPMYGLCPSTIKEAYNHWIRH